MKVVGVAVGVKEKNRERTKREKERSRKKEQEICLKTERDEEKWTEGWEGCSGQAEWTGEVVLQK